MDGQVLRRFLLTGVIGVAATAVSLILWAAGILTPFEQKTWDWRERALEAPGKATGQIALIMLDQKSLDWGKNANQLSWPWPREVYNYIINFCKRGGARSIAFDVLYTEPSKYGVYDDQSFGDSIAQSGFFVGAVSLGDASDTRSAWPGSTAEPGVAIAGLDSWLRTTAGYTRAPGGSAGFGAGDANAADTNAADTNAADTNAADTNAAGTNAAGTNAAGTNAAGTNAAGTNASDAAGAAAGAANGPEIPARDRFLVFRSASFPVPEVNDAVRMLGNVTLSPDSDGVYRRGNLFALFDGRVVPSLGFAAYLAGNPGKHTISIRPGTLTVDNTNVPIDSDGSAYLRYRGPSQTHKSYSAAAVIQSELQVESGDKPNIDPSVFKDKYVIFGFTAPGLFDLRPAPVGGIYAGMEVHATMLDNLLSGDFIHTVAPLWVILIALALALAAAGVMYLVSGTAGNIVTYVVALPVPVGVGLLAYAWGGRLPIVMPELAVVFSLVGSGIAKYVIEGAQKRYIKGAFRQYLSPVVIEQLIAHPDRLKLGGEKRELSIFFSDLQGFTSISEGLSPEELTALLNEYLSAMTDIIQDEGGTIDKYEGDAIIAFWNAPVEQPDHAVRAVRAALRCQEKLEQMRPEFQQRIGKAVYKRIGINTGPAVVGNMGSSTRFDYTMLGDSVNLASRLEGVNKQFGTYTMISSMTKDAIGDAFPCRELSRIAVVGRSEPVRVFEPMTEHRFAARKEDISVFADGLGLYYGGDFQSAANRFGQIAERDPAASSYLAKCSRLLEAPPEEWNGVWVMTEK